MLRAVPRQVFHVLAYRRMNGGPKVCTVLRVLSPTFRMRATIATRRLSRSLFLWARRSTMS